MPHAPQGLLHPRVHGRGLPEPDGALDKASANCSAEVRPRALPETGPQAARGSCPDLAPAPVAPRPAGSGRSGGERCGVHAGDRDLESAAPGPSCWLGAMAEWHRRDVLDPVMRCRQCYWEIPGGSTPRSVPGSSVGLGAGAWPRGLRLTTRCLGGGGRACSVCGLRPEGHRRSVSAPLKGPPPLKSSGDGLSCLAEP